MYLTRSDIEPTNNSPQVNKSRNPIPTWPRQKRCRPGIATSPIIAVSKTVCGSRFPVHALCRVRNKIPKHLARHVRFFSRLWLVLVVASSVASCRTMSSWIFSVRIWTNHEAGDGASGKYSETPHGSRKSKAANSGASHHKN